MIMKEINKMNEIVSSRHFYSYQSNAFDFWCILASPV